MSSEMREVDAFEAWARAQCFGEEELRRIEGRPANKFGLTWEYNGDSVQAAWAAWLERALLARTEAGADHGAADHGIDLATKESLVPCDCGCGRSCCAFCGADLGFVTHPQDASGDAVPVLFGRDSGGDWYVNAETKSICVDVDFDPARQLSLILKQDGSVAWSIFVQEPDSSTTKATGPSVMNPGFYEALSYIAMQAKEAK